MGAWIAIVAVAVSAVVLFATHDSESIGGLSHETFARLVAGLALVVFLGSAVMGSYRGRLGAAARDLLAWMLVLAGLVGLYAYRSDLLVVAERVAGELLPPGMHMTVQQEPGKPAAVRIRRSWHGHFTARAKVNGAFVDMIVDTGASAVVLTGEDAERAGIDTSKLRYLVPVETANGRSYAARVRLQEVSIGPLMRRNVEALIAAPGSLNKSLLGMSFLSRLRSYEFSGDFLTLRG